jgi:hypothetical protein
VEPESAPFIDWVLFTTDRYDKAAKQCRSLQATVRALLANKDRIAEVLKAAAA